jgi:predicted alpha-1,6-mannanase (GH76 family)
MMKVKFVGILHRSMIYLFTMLMLVLGATHSAQAQWTASDTKNAWNGYNSAYFYTGPEGYEGHFATTIGGSTAVGFWAQAELIEMAVDAYVWAETNDPSNLSTYENKVESLCDGFEEQHGDGWSSDNYNDDLNVAIIAFARAYHVTGTTKWLTDAENNFATVWGRTQEGNGGICQNVKLGCYENSSANWTFVIAGHMINNYNGGTGSYLSEAEGVYTWALANLYQSSKGQIYDARNGVTGQYSYNYGYAIGAMSESAAGEATIGNVATYLFNDLSNYAGTTSSGYNILPNYGQGANDNDGGFNGIVMRWINTANVHGYIPQCRPSGSKSECHSGVEHSRIFLRTPGLSDVGRLGCRYA